MPIDPSIVGQLRPVQFDTDKLVNMIALGQQRRMQAESHAQQMQNMQLEQQQHQIALENARRAQSDDAFQRQAFAQSGGDLNKYRSMLAQGPNPQALVAFDKQQLEAREKLAKLRKDELDNHKAAAAAIGSAGQALLGLPDENARATAWPEARNGLITSGVAKPEEAPEQYPGQQWLQYHTSAAIAADKQLELEYKRREDARAAEEAKAKSADAAEKAAQRQREENARLHPDDAAAQAAALTANQRAEDTRAKAQREQTEKFRQATLGIQRARLALEGGTTIMVPNPNGGFTATRVRPGDQVPEGAVTAAGMSSQNTPTAASRSMMEAAPKVENLVTRVEQLINEQEKNLGPGSSRFREFLAGKLGGKDQEYTRLRTDVSLLQTALMRMHVGARGGTEMMKHFSDLIDASKQDPDNLRAALGEIRAYANTVQGKHTNTGGPAVGTVEKGYRFKGGDPANPQNWEKAK